MEIDEFPVTSLQILPGNFELLCWIEEGMAHIEGGSFLATSLRVLARIC
jgi:hypothetical protein